MADGAGGHAVGQELRRPPLVVAIALMALVVCVELGAHFLLRPDAPGDLLGALRQDASAGPVVSKAIADTDLGTVQGAVAQAGGHGRPPGLAIPDLALLDGLILLGVLVIGLGLLSQPVVGRTQGIVTLLVSLGVAIGSLVAIVVAFVKLLLMLALFLSPPFGTIAYFALFGFFDRGGAVTAIGLLLALKLGVCIALLVAQQRFLQNKGLVIGLALSLVLSLVVGFLHAVVPFPLTSITDAIGGIVVGIVALVWAVVTLVFSIYAVVRAIA